MDSTDERFISDAEVGRFDAEDPVEFGRPCDGVGRQVKGPTTDSGDPLRLGQVGLALTQFRLGAQGLGDVKNNGQTKPTTIQGHLVNVNVGINDRSVLLTMFPQPGIWFPGRVRSSAVNNFGTSSGGRRSLIVMD